MNGVSSVDETVKSTKLSEINDNQGSSYNYSYQKMGLTEFESAYIH